MGGCITQPKKYKKTNETNNGNNKGRSKIKDSHQIASKQKIQEPNNLDLTAQKSKNALREEKRKNRSMSSSQFTSMYRIQQNVENATRIQGPKFISNIIDGSCSVLRILNFGEYDKNRLQIYKDILNLTVYQDQGGNILVMQDYYCGPTLDQLLKKLGNMNRQNQGQQGSINDQLQEIRDFLTGVYKIIDKFHQKNIVLGNLNLFSFRQVSEFDPNIVLTDLQFQLNYDDFMGHAHKDGQQADWQSLGYIIQTVLGKWPPIYIHHKIQYMDTGSNMINSLLKGNRIKIQEINQIKDQDINKCNQQIIAGYKLRRDINKLLKVRRKRTPHPAVYYSEEAFKKQPNTKVSKLPEDMTHRTQTARILERIQTYLEEVTPKSQQAFLSYNDGTQSLKKLKPVFVLEDPVKKYQQLKDTLLLLK